MKEIVALYSVIGVILLSRSGGGARIVNTS